MHNGEWGNTNRYHGSNHNNGPKHWGKGKGKGKGKHNKNDAARTPQQWQSPVQKSPAYQAPLMPQQAPEAQVVDTQGPMAVNLQDLPATLCRQVTLEAMMEQAGIASNITGLILGQDQDIGKALVYLTDFQSAQKCAAHFHGCTWSSGGPAVTANIINAPTSPIMAPQVPPTFPGMDKMPSGKDSKRNCKKRAELPPPAVFQPGWADFPQFPQFQQEQMFVEDREQVSTDAGSSSRTSWHTDQSGVEGFCGCDTDDGF